VSLSQIWSSCVKRCICIRRSVPKFGEGSGVVPCSGVVADGYLCYHTECGRFKSNRVGFSRSREGFGCVRPRPLKWVHGWTL